MTDDGPFPVLSSRPRPNPCERTTAGCVGCASTRPGFWKLVAAKSATDRVAYEPAAALVRVVSNEAALRPLGRVGYR